MRIFVARVFARLSFRLERWSIRLYRTQSRIEAHKQIVRETVSNRAAVPERAARVKVTLAEKC